jgi:hypothetical protein
MKNASAYPSSLVLVWLSLVAILVGNFALTRAAKADMWYDWRSDQGRDHCSDALLQVHAWQMYQPVPLMLDTGAAYTILTRQTALT